MSQETLSVCAQPEHGPQSVEAGSTPASLDNPAGERRPSACLDQERRDRELIDQGLATDYESLTGLAIAIVTVPSEWQPATWKTLPPRQHSNMPLVASRILARVLNSERMERAARKGLPVESWSVVCCKRGGVVTMTGLQGFYPTSPDDLPECVLEFEGTYKQAVERVKQMNRELLKASRWAVVVNPVDADDDAIRIEQLVAQMAADRKARHEAKMADRPPMVSELRAGTAAVVDLDQAEPTGSQIACQNDFQSAGGRASKPEDFRQARVGIVHPHFGTLAVSDKAFGYGDLDRILSEARTAIVMAGSEGGAA